MGIYSIRVFASNPTPKKMGLKQKETLLYFIADGVYGVKQSPRIRGDCHVASSFARSGHALQ